MRVNIRAGNVLCECWPADPSIPCAASDPGFSVLRPDWMAIGPEDITAFRRGERVVDGIQTGCWNRAPLNDGTDDHHVHWPWELNARPFGLEVEDSCANPNIGGFGRALGNVSTARRYTDSVLSVILNLVAVVSTFAIEWPPSFAAGRENKGSVLAAAESV